MTSFINTMCVLNTLPLHYVPQPKPLPAIHSNVYAEPETHVHQAQLQASPPHSVAPLQKHIQSLSELAEHPIPHQTDLPLPATQHQGPPSTAGLMLFGRNNWKQVVSKDDLLTRSDSNARNRHQTAFQPQKRAKGTSTWQLKLFAEATLGSGSLRKVVQLPEGEDRDEWLAVNVVDFYNQINLLYGAVTEFCSPQSCPEMKATDEFEYLWHDPPAYPKPTRLPAPTYISNLLTWTSNHLSNPNEFPTHPGVPFPDGFEKTVKQILKRLYRIYAHIYCHHYGVVRGLGLEAHLNTGFKHFVLFVEEFDLADEKGAKKSEWRGPLGELVESMLRSE